MRLPNSSFSLTGPHQSGIHEMSPMRIGIKQAAIAYQVYNHNGEHKMSPSRRILAISTRIAELQVRTWTISQHR